jgi:DNA-binding XRE family transcriptional regulator
MLSKISSKSMYKHCPMKTILSLPSKHAFLVSLGQQIKKLRHEKNMSQSEFSRLSGIHRTYISAIEKGEKNITLISMLKIAKALNITAGEILDISTQ